MMLAVLIREPNGTAAKVMTWIPFTAGPGRHPAREQRRGAAGLVGDRRLAGGAGRSRPGWPSASAARLFRIGLLSAGARPSLREIVRQARLAA